MHFKLPKNLMKISRVQFISTNIIYVKWMYVENCPKLGSYLLGVEIGNVHVIISGVYLAPMWEFVNWLKCWRLNHSHNCIELCDFMMQNKFLVLIFQLFNHRFCFVRRNILATNINGLTSSIYYANSIINLKTVHDETKAHDCIVSEIVQCHARGKKKMLEIFRREEATKIFVCHSRMKTHSGSKRQKARASTKFP